MATPFLYYWSWWQARSCDRGRGGSERAAGAQFKVQEAAREAAPLRDEMSEYLQQGVARSAIAGAEAWYFYSTLVLSALINNS